PELRVPTGRALSILAPDRPPAPAAAMIDWLLAEEGAARG
ncbi:MAG: LysR family transcriptional regulator, partial [Mesorhizobium sp.]